jgi:hypothetical protein
MHTCSSTLLYYLQHQHCYDNKLQSKMYSWNEWLAWLCLLSNAHIGSTAVVLQHAADCVHDVIQNQDVQLNGWHGSAC